MVKGIKKKYKCPYPSCKDKPEFERTVIYDSGKSNTDCLSSLHEFTSYLEKRINWECGWKKTYT